MLKNRMVSGIITSCLLLTPTNTVSASTNVENEISFNKINNDTNEDDFSLMTRYLNFNKNSFISQFIFL